MSVFYYDPFHDAECMMNETFGRTGNQNQSQALQRQNSGSGDVRRAIRPRQLIALFMALHEDPKANTVTAIFELPGIKKEDVEIGIHNGRLGITVESKISETHERDGYYDS
ncbi:hypothetical protein K438DRAFT_2013979 [Mycena galopus ATCC 62051]|nr:hypothetical protein K438DRAFT_2013979 [Mycena galopus ATCC 62051]